MTKRLVLFSSVLIAMVLVGCAASVKQSNVNEARPVTQAVHTPAGTSRGGIAVVLSGPDTIMKSSDWPSLTNDWRELLPDSASETKVNATFITSESGLSENQTMLVRIKVNDFRYISTAKRFMLGVMAGNAYMDLDIEYVQLPSRQVVSSKKINTSSSAWEGIFSAVTPKQVNAVSRVVLQDAKRLNN